LSFPESYKDTLNIIILFLKGLQKFDPKLLADLVDNIELMRGCRSPLDYAIEAEDEDLLKWMFSRLLSEEFKRKLIQLIIDGTYQLDKFDKSYFSFASLMMRYLFDYGVINALIRSRNYSDFCAMLLMDLLC
jgi:hypothetical protein